MSNLTNGLGFRALSWGVAVEDAVVGALGPWISRLNVNLPADIKDWQDDSLRIRALLASKSSVREHPQFRDLLDLITRPVTHNDEGFPEIDKDSYRFFRDNIPHLFESARVFLDWKDAVIKEVDEAHSISEHAKESVKAALRVYQRIVETSALNAPGDLWHLRQILTTYKKQGVLLDLAYDREINIQAYAFREGWDAKVMEMDFKSLLRRGYLVRLPNGNYKAKDDFSKKFFEQFLALPDYFFVGNIVHSLTAYFKGENFYNSSINEFFSSRADIGTRSPDWRADFSQMEIGYRLMPLVLSMAQAGLLKDISKGKILNIPRLTPYMKELLCNAGLVVEDDSKKLLVTQLGERVFKRTPKLFRILYYRYFDRYYNNHLKNLKGEPVKEKKFPEENLNGSEEANYDHLKLGVDLLDGEAPEVFIEHAVANGIGTKIQHGKNPDANTAYFGFDYYDESADGARARRDAGKLPANMIIHGGVDIADYQTLIDKVNEAGFSTEGAILVVSAGLQEIGKLTDDEVAEVHAGYRKAGIHLVRIETPKPTEEQALEMAWLFWEIFCYEHEASGQAIRSIVKTPGQERLSWPEIDEKAGYHQVKVAHGRRILPYPAPLEENPPIYFAHLLIPKNEGSSRVVNHQPTHQEKSLRRTALARSARIGRVGRLARSFV